MNEHYHILSFNFATKEAADKTLGELKDADDLDIINAAIMYRDKNGKVTYYETDDVTAARGAVVGAVEGALLGLLGGPGGALIGAVAGGLTGGATAYIFDGGIDNDTLESLSKSLPRDTASLVALVEHDEYENVLEYVREKAADVFNVRVDENLANEIHRYRYPND